MLSILKKPLLCVLAWLPLYPVHAATQPDVYTFTMTANVVQAASCKLNDGREVKVSFGDLVEVGKINGYNYKTPVEWNFHCDSVGKNEMTLQIEGAEADFGQGLLYVRPGLAIEIRQGDTLLPLNTPLAFDGSNPPVLTAVPVKNKAAVLTLGAFEATATIKVNYE